MLQKCLNLISNEYLEPWDRNLPNNVDSTGSSTVSEGAESSTRQINAVGRWAARAGILDCNSNAVALTTDAIGASKVGDENLAATVLGGP